MYGSEIAVSESVESECVGLVMPGVCAVRSLSPFPSYTHPLFGFDGGSSDCTSLLADMLECRLFVSSRTRKSFD